VKGGCTCPCSQLQLQAKRPKQRQKRVQLDARLTLLNKTDKALGHSSELREIVLRQPESGTPCPDFRRKIIGEGRFDTPPPSVRTFRLVHFSTLQRPILAVQAVSGTNVPERGQEHACEGACNAGSSRGT
jgi:hypothetical protein